MLRALMLGEVRFVLPQLGLRLVHLRDVGLATGGRGDPRTTLQTTAEARDLGPVLKALRTP